MHSVGFGQKLDNINAKTVLNRISHNYLTENYSLRYTKTIFRSIEDVEPMEVSTGIFYVGNMAEYRIEEPGTLIIQNKELNLTIDSASNMVYLSEPDEDYLPMEMRTFMTDSLMDFYSFSLLKKKNFHQLTIENKNELSHSIILQVDPVSYEVRKFIYHMPVGNYFSESIDDETVESPVLEIAYNKIKKEKFNVTFFSHEKWIVKDKMPVELRKEITQFEINDLRVKSHF